MTKAQLRKAYRLLRKKLSEEDIETKSLDIANQLLKLPIWDKSFYHIFLSITEQKEINTDYILSILSGKDKHIVISKSDFETFEMTHYLLSDNTKLKKNIWNIPEPVSGIKIDTEQIEVVFIPLLVFDKKGNRIGYGKGFYDKFLAQCQPNTLKVGLSFFSAENEISDMYKNDITIDYCVTPSSIYQF